jgi:hypothetical protein
LTVQRDVPPHQKRKARASGSGALSSFFKVVQPVGAFASVTETEDEEEVEKK